MRVCIIRVVVGVCERLRRGVYPTPLAVHLARVGNENSFRGQSDCRFQPLTTHIFPLTRIWFNTKFTRRTVSLFLHNWHFSFITAKQCFFKRDSVYFSSASACPAKLFVRRRNHDFRQRNGELESFQSNVSHFALLLLWHNSLDNIFKLTLFSKEEKKRSKKLENR